MEDNSISMEQQISQENLQMVTGGCGTCVKNAEKAMHKLDGIVKNMDGYRTAKDTTSRMTHLDNATDKINSVYRKGLALDQKRHYTHVFSPGASSSKG